MIACLIRWSIHNRFLVLLATVLVRRGVLFGPQTPLDALPDLSDTQVIIKASTGQSTQVVEDQVTYRSRRRCLVCLVRKPSLVFVVRRRSYMSFDDKTDQYWATLAVLSNLNQVQSRCRRRDRFRLARIAPVGRCTNMHSSTKRATRLGQLRALNDWFLKFELKSVRTSPKSRHWWHGAPYQVVARPDKLRATASRKWRWPTRSARRTRIRWVGR